MEGSAHFRAAKGDYVTIIDLPVPRGRENCHEPDAQMHAIVAAKSLVAGKSERLSADKLNWLATCRHTCGADRTSA